MKSRHMSILDLLTLTQELIVIIKSLKFMPTTDQKVTGLNPVGATHKNKSRAYRFCFCECGEINFLLLLLESV